MRRAVQGFTLVEMLVTSVAIADKLSRRGA